MNLAEIKQAIIDDPANKTWTQQGIKPLYQVSPKAKIMIVGQAPGLSAQIQGRSWDDQSGNRLRAWMGIDRASFYDPEQFALLPMDFYYPGKCAPGYDAPPRKDFAPKWHPLLRKQMPEIRLILLFGQYAQAYYLGNKRQKNLTLTVKHWKDYQPLYMPLIHPSARNGIWLSKNPWFMQEVIPQLKEKIQEILI